MKSLVLAFAGFLLSYCISAQNLYFPPLTGNTWETISPGDLGWCTNEIDGLYNHLELNNTKAFILLKDGKIALEKYFGTFTGDSIWYWASAGKVLTSFLAGMAQQEGKLSISDTSSQYLGPGWTSLTPEQEEKITVRHQLTMTTGLDDGVPDNYCTLDNCLIYLAEAGTRWAYHNAPYTLLDEVLQAATGSNLNIYLNQKIKAPTGMNGLFVPLGYNMVYFSNARSMARFGLLIMAGGNWNGNLIMSDTIYFNEMISPSQDLNKSYGYLWWLNGKESFMVPGFQFVFSGWICPNAPEDMIAALGKNGQIINVVQSKQLVLIRMGNAPDNNEIGITLNDSIWYYLNRIIDCTGTSAENHINKQTLTVYPNPASGLVKIVVPFPGCELELLDNNGIFIKHLHVNNQDCIIDMHGLRPGLYFIRWISGQEVIIKKLILAG